MFFQKLNFFSAQYLIKRDKKALRAKSCKKLQFFLPILVTPLPILVTPLPKSFGNVSARPRPNPSGKKELIDPIV